MLNSTKTWEKEFDEIFGENHHKICIGKNCECHKVVKQFISDIRKRDMEALIGMLPKEGDEKYELSPTDRQIGYDIALETIKDYYEK